MEKELIIGFIISFLAVFAITTLLLRWLIPFLKSLKVGQKILEIGPRWHKSKEGTPTMGGISFIISTLIVLSGFAIYCYAKGEGKLLIPLALTLCLAVINGLIGFIDDRCKLLKKENEGLKAYQKYILQLIAAGIYLFSMYKTGYIDTTLHVPFTNIEWELGIFYYLFALILITGMVNAVNLTDGIDGLASGVTCVVGIFFAIYSFVFNFFALNIISACIIGGTLGFLIYNFYPARVFMGDTGSLFLGGMVTGCAFMINDPLIIILCGIIYVAEAMSDIIQVGCYKITKKRVFKMAPIHHHFEKSGWSEIKIFIVFTFVTVLGCIIAWLSI